MRLPAASDELAVSHCPFGGERPLVDPRFVEPPDEPRASPCRRRRSADGLFVQCKCSSPGAASEQVALDDVNVLVVGEAGWQRARPSGIALDSHDAAGRVGERGAQRCLIGTEVDGQVVEFELREGHAPGGLGGIAENVPAKPAAALVALGGALPRGGRRCDLDIWATCLFSDEA